MFNFCVFIFWSQSFWTIFLDLGFRVMIRIRARVKFFLVLWFMVQQFRLKTYGLVFEFLSFVFWAQIYGIMVQSQGQGQSFNFLGFGVQGLGFKVKYQWFSVLCLVFGILGLWLRVYGRVRANVWVWVWVQIV